MKKWSLIVGIMILLCSILTACGSPATPTPTVAPPTQTPAPPTSTPSTTPTPVTPTATPTSSPTATPIPTPPPLVITSQAFAANADIPERYGFYRENVSPDLAWEGVPEGAKSLVLLMDDLNYPFSHWVVFNIPPDADGFPEGAVIEGVVQGKNSNETNDYAGPYPPVGERHRYAFQLYALDKTLGLSSAATRKEVIAAMKGHILAQGELVGKYLGVNR